MYLGFDTSNYTTSVALFDGNDIIQAKKLLYVKTGERGLRQSDAVFQHTVNMPEILAELEYDKSSIDAVAVSTRPRNIEKSYMPCFMVGKGIADAVSKFTSSRLYYTSHQVGHILAALYSVGRLDLVEHQFIAFHVSGGTTEALLVTPDKDEISCLLSPFSIITLALFSIPESEQSSPFIEGLILKFLSLSRENLSSSFPQGKFKPRSTPVLSIACPAFKSRL